MTGSSVDCIHLLIPSLDDKGRHWQRYSIGEEVELRDGVYLGSKGSAVVYQGVLVAAWDKPNQIIPHGSPRQQSEMIDLLHLEDVVSHIAMSSLKEACRMENLNWEIDCLPRISTLIQFVGLEIDPVRICMVACAKLKRLIKEGKE